MRRKPIHLFDLMLLSVGPTDIEQDRDVPHIVPLKQNSLPAGHGDWYRRALPRAL